MSYCSVNKTRMLTGLSSDRIGDGQLRDLRDEFVVPYLNEDIQTIISDEKVEYISSDKENLIDGSNKTFYAKEVDGSHTFIGDYNDDAVIDDSDVKAVQVDGDERNVLNVTLEDHEIGELTIEKQNGDAVEDGNIFLDYAVAPADMKEPAKMVELACAQLTAVFGFSNIEAENFENFSIGSVTVNESSTNASEFLSDYMKTVSLIGQREMIQAAENTQDIENVFNKGSSIR